MAKIGILGASGFLGSAIFDHLSELSKHKTFGYSRKNQKHIELKPNDFENLSNLDIVINCAGPSNDTCSNFPEKAHTFYDVYQNNLLDFCLSQNIKLITLSTIHVYQKDLIFIDENSKLDKETPYTKYRNSFENRIISNEKKNIILLRLGNCFGVSSSTSAEMDKLLLNSIASSYKKDINFFIKSKKDFYRYYVPISYLLEIITKLVEVGKFPAPLINVVNQDSTSAKQLIKIFHELTGKNFIKFSFEGNEINKKISNDLCSSFLEYNDLFFLNEIKALLK